MAYFANRKDAKAAGQYSRRHRTSEANIKATQTYKESRQPGIRNNPPSKKEN